MSDSDEEYVPPKGKKRQLHKEEHVREKEKIARRHGEEFVTSKGVLVQAKTTGPNCECKRKCTDSFSMEEKDNIIKSVYNGRPKNEQDTFLIGLIERFDVARHRPSNETSKKHDSSFKYFAMKTTTRVEVCRRAYISLHALSHKIVLRLTHILAANQTPADKRGKHENRSNAIPPDVLIKINEHIDSFPKRTSHYSSTPVTYLDATLNVKKMHELFIEKYPEYNNKIKYEYYLEYYNKNFGFRFGRPQVDVCSTCEDLIIKMKSTNLNENAKRAASAEYIVHKRRANKFYKKVDEIEKLSKTRPDVMGIAFDYMQNLPLPFLPVQEMFYLRKLWFYVFNVCDMKNNKAYFYTYSEGEANKGPNEVCSMVLSFIDNHVPDDVKELHVFSDACGGQNRNHALCRLLCSLTMTNRFKVVHQYYPVRGHSFMPCDRMFGTLKREVRVHDRVYSPKEYNTMIKNAKKNDPPFQVETVGCQSILDFKKWWPQYFVKLPASIENKKDKFKISQCRHLVFKNDPKGYVVTSPFIDNPVKKTFKLKKTNTIQLPDTQAHPTGKVPIKKKKLQDLRKIIHYIPDEYRPFFEEKLSWPTSANDRNPSDDEENSDS